MLTPLLLNEFIKSERLETSFYSTLIEAITPIDTTQPNWKEVFKNMLGVDIVGRNSVVFKNFLIPTPDGSKTPASMTFDFAGVKFSPVEKSGAIKQALMHILNNDVVKFNEFIIALSLEMEGR